MRLDKEKVKESTNYSRNAKDLVLIWFEIDIIIDLKIKVLEK